MTGPEPYFRHAFGHLVATLTRRVGAHRLDEVEDAVQAALMAAVEAWPRTGEPDAPTAWLYRVAHNQLAGAARKAARRRSILQSRWEPPGTPNPEPPGLSSEMQDDFLRMLFVCCDEVLPRRSQLVVALQVLCGFDVKEIADRLFMTEANVYKRLSRARATLRRAELDAEMSAERAEARRPGVLETLYVLFAEGHLSSRAEHPLRLELCREAVRLTTLLAEHPYGRSADTYALLALMHFQAARMVTRWDEDTGGLLLLEEQDRSRLDPRHLQAGLTWLARSATGETFSRYHAEAAVAVEHALAPSFEETRWDRIVEAYTLLDRVAPSALHTLNRAVAVAELHGPQAGLETLEAFEPPSWLSRSYYWSAVLADLHRRVGDEAAAAQHRKAALELAPSSAVRAVLERRLSSAEVGGR